MLRDIIFKELLDTISSLKFVFTFLLCTVLVLLAVFTGINNYRAELREYHASVALNRSNLESQPNYMTLAGYGFTVTKTPQVLSTIVTGVQNAVGKSAKVSTNIDPGLGDSKYSSSPAFAIFGELDLTFIVRIVLSLLAILFTFDAISGEKEQGTLKLALANSLPRDRLILGKAIGSFISLILPLVIPLIIALLILTIYPDVNLLREDWLRIGLIFLMFILYISVFFTLGLFVSARTLRSSTSLLVLLMVWVTFVTIIPKAAVITAGVISPVPSAQEIAAQKDAVKQEAYMGYQQSLNEWMEQNRPKTPEEGKAFQEKFKEFLEQSQKEMLAYQEEKNATIETGYQARKKKQEGLAFNISRLSPASSLMFGAMSLSRTGINENDRFVQSIRSYTSVFASWVNVKMMRNLKLGSVEQVKPDLSDMPQHEFKPENLKSSLVRAIPDFTILSLLIILFFTGAFVSFLKYDVR